MYLKNLFNGSKLVTLLLALSLLSGCNTEDNKDIELPKDKAPCDDCGKYIWIETSQRLVIIKDSGNFPSANNSIIIDHQRDTLPRRAKEKLEQIVIDNSAQTCSSDGMTYEIIITDESGLESVYFSDNKACGDSEVRNFIATREINDLLTLFRYSCTGKTFCSEMVSCEEAVFYLRYCPATKIDGDNDGVPCERQWCS